MNKIKGSFLLLFLVSIMAFAQQKKYVPYTVKQGESIKSIAKNYDISTRDLLKLNPDVDRKPNAGVVIIVPNESFGKQEVGSVRSTANPKSDKYFYEVLPKETLFGISKKFNVSISEINAANPELIHGLKSGMKLIVPNKVPVQDNENFVLHTVVKDDTVFNLSKRYQVSQSDLFKLNLSLNDGLKLGMVLKIKPIQGNPIVDIEEKTEANDELFDEDETGLFIENLDLNKRINVAIMLPYQLSKLNDSIKNESFGKNNALLSIATDFHMGAEMAIDSLRRKGLMLNVKYFDSENSISKLQSIVTITDFNNVDVIIGPLFFDKAYWLSQQVSTPVVVPFLSSKQGGISKDNLIKSSANSETLTIKLLSHLENLYKGENIIVVNDGKEESQSKLWHIVNKLKGFDSVSSISVIKPEKGYIANAKFLEKLNPESKNWVILISDENVTTASTINNLKGFISDMEIKLIALDKGKNFDNVDNNTLGMLNFLYPSSDFLNMSNSHVNNFFNSYQEKNFSLPSSYALRGFDVTYDTLVRIASSINIEEGLNSGKSSRMVSLFNYDKKPLESFENKGVYLIQYNKELVPVVFH
jgi:LysM repeat protein